MAAYPDHPDITLWRERIHEWYPDLYKQTFFLPSVHMNRTQYEVVQLKSGENVLQTPTPGKPSGLSSSDTRDDECQQKVLTCLHRLKEEHPQVMFVLSQLEFVNYLNCSCFAAAASQLSRPVDLKAQNDHRGEFDVLIIHRHYGIIVVEIKAIGDQMSDLLQEEQRQKIETRVLKSIKQIQKEERVLKYLLRGLLKQPRILKTLMLPNATKAQLLDMLNNKPATHRDLCTCLGIPQDGDPVPFCLTLEDIADPEHPDDVTGPNRWWQKRVIDSGPDPSMTDALYLDVVSRFGGPATTVKVFCSSEPHLAVVHQSDIRTPGDGVEEMGNRFTPVNIVLHPEQVDTLNNDKLTEVYVTGPPGTGKSLILQLKAIEWIREGQPVHVVSTWKESLAASYFLVKQMEKTENTHLIQLHHLELDDRNDADNILETLGKAADDHDGKLFVIMDEVFAYGQDVLNDFFIKLRHRVPKLNLWAASMFFRERPKDMDEIRLTVPLRTPPLITQEVEKNSKMKKDPIVYQYTEPKSPLPAEGVQPRVLFHTGEGHDEDECVYDCIQCGKNIAGELQQLNVGGADRASTSPRALQYRDVFLLTYYGNLHDTQTDDSGNVTEEASGLIRGLREAGIPVTILVEEDDTMLKEVATMEGPNDVFAAQSTKVQGLERKIVVFAQADGLNSENEDRGRLQAMSRCTAQLIWVKPPLPPPDKISH